MNVEFYDPAYKAWVKMYAHSDGANCRSYIQNRQGGKMDMLARTTTAYPRKDGYQYYRGGTHVGKSMDETGLDLPQVKAVMDFYPRDEQYERGLYWLEIISLPDMRSKNPPQRYAKSGWMETKTRYVWSYPEVVEKAARSETRGHSGIWAVVRRVDNDKPVAAYYEGRSDSDLERPDREYASNLKYHQQAMQGFVGMGAEGWQSYRIHALKSALDLRGGIGRMKDVAKVLNDIHTEMTYISGFARMDENQRTIWNYVSEEIKILGTTLLTADPDPKEDRTNE